MKYNQLGSTGMKVSPIAVGGAAFSNIYGSFNEEKSLELIRETINCGVNFLETGPWYGQGSSERTMGKLKKAHTKLLPKTPYMSIWQANALDISRYADNPLPPNDFYRIIALAEFPRESYFISSKVGRYELETERMFDFSKEKTEAGVDNTLQRLGLDYVDLIQIHDCTFAPDLSIVLKETLPALERAVKDGKVKFIGVADYDLDLMKELIEESEVTISTILSYSKSTLFDNRLQNYTKYFKGKGIGVINAAATGMGLLTNKGPQPWHPASDDVKAICKRASEYCKAQNVELARLATWFTLNQPDIDTHVCGFFNLEQFKDTIDVLERGLSAHEKKVLADVQNRFFDKVTLHWDNVELPAYKAELDKILKK